MTETLAIGSQAHADTMGAYLRDEIFITELYDMGWEYVSAGTARAVFRGPDGFVYKVNVDGQSAAAYGDDSNTAEYHNYLEWKDCLPSGFAIPRMELYRSGDEVILCAEYVKGKPADDDGKLYYISEYTMLDDLFDENVLVDSHGVYWLVDIEC